MQYQLTPYQQKKCREFFQYQKVGEFIYAGHLKSRIGVSIDVAYAMLEDLKKQGYLVNLFEVYCFDCNKSKGLFLESLEQFDSDLYCDFCGKKLSLEENIIVLYKVVHV
ncbi:MAG: hypothetical protein IJE43_12145 [Alphaproteobacteria bacterium]|nr:hypothetical protein [Alphaproteobacteria bacterium]